MSIRIRRGKESDERGAILPMAAGLLVLMVGMAAFATDLGWWFLNISRTQRAADAAALAGVVYMPGFFSLASDEALRVAHANGYTDGSLGGPATVTPAVVPDEPYQLEVTVTQSVNTFFLKVFGFGSIDITRSAVAEYVLPVPLGSPLNKFGDGADPSQNYWAAINGPYSPKANGDSFATRCINSSTWNACSGSLNPDYRASGYWYAIEVLPGSDTLTVELYDPGFYEQYSKTSDETNPRDRRYSGSSAAHEPKTLLSQKMVDPTPLDPFDNPNASCTAGPGTIVLDPEDTTPNTKNQWYTLCMLAGPLTPGIYPLNVANASGTVGSSNNSYSVRAMTASGPQPRLYAIGDMSIRTLDPGAGRFYVAEVAEVHAGKDFQIKLFDPGDTAGGTNFINVYDPFNTMPPCTYRVVTESGAVEESGSLANCSINATRPAHDFNGDWVEVTIPLPNNYTCNTADAYPCWWEVDLDYSGGAFDRTTWTAEIIGNPIHLVP